MVGATKVSHFHFFFIIIVIVVIIIIINIIFFLDIRNNTYLTSIAECVLDLNYVVDSSGSINYKGGNNYGLMLQFIANVSNFFTIGPKDTQVACVLFSTEATVEWGLTRYQDKTSLINAIRNVPYIGDETNLNDALNLTWSDVFAPGRGTRPNARKVTVILTDGEDNVPSIGTPLTLENAARCKRDGIRLIAVGVTYMIDRNRLMQIVSSPSDFYTVNDFIALQSIVTDLTQQICGAHDSTSIVTHTTYKRQNYIQQEAQLMLTTSSTRLAVSRGQQTWYHSTCYI